MRFRIFILSLAVLFLHSCSKEEENTDPSSSYYIANVDGVAWKSAKTRASIANGNIVVMGEAADGTILTFSLTGDSVDVYALNENSNSSGTFFLAKGSVPFTTGASSLAGGQVLIESINKTERLLTGSIELTVVRSSDDSTIQISGGRFVNIPYDNIPLGIGDNELKCKVNGSNWTPQGVSGFVAFNTIYLQALDADGIRQLTFEIPEMIAPGNYELNYFTNYKAVYTNNNQKQYYATSGKLEIEFHNLVKRELEAKFEIITKNYEGGGKLTFTEGTFRITYE